jgi:hypothetical protein
MSTRSKFFYVLFVLIFAFTSLAAGAFAGVQHSAAHNGQLDTAYHVDSASGGPSFSIAGHCDIAPACGSGGG